MSETKESLHRLIARYRERMNEGGGFEVMTFCLQRIQEAEQKLFEIERRSETTRVG